MDSDIRLRLRNICWDRIDDAAGAAEELLMSLASNRSLLRGLIQHASKDDHLLSLCEATESFDKIVICDDPESRCRIRIHYWDPSFEDSPHDHRYSFSSLMLHGAYLHSIFGVGSAVLPASGDGSVAPRFRAMQTAGTSYTLHHSIVHTASRIDRSGTLTLMLRGPIVEAKRDQDYLQLDAACEPVVPAERLPLGSTRFDRLASELGRVGLI